MDEKKNKNKQEIYVLMFALFCLGLSLIEILGNVITELWHI
jgi:hypothetical protein